VAPAKPHKMARLRAGPAPSELVPPHRGRRATAELEPTIKMTKHRGHAPGPRVPVHDGRNLIARVGRRVSGALRIVRSGATLLVERVPGTIRATRAGAEGTTTALQTLPDPTLRWLAAGSVGLGAGLSLAGAPRLVVAAGVAPALIVGAAMALRQGEPVVSRGDVTVTAVS
jgi:hypothetical protein